MRIFSRIVGKIFPPDHPAVRDAQHATSAAAGAPAAPPQGPLAPGAAAPEGPPAQATKPDQRADATPAQPTSSMPPVDVGAVLAAMAAKHPRPLDYRTSIVDLLDLLDLDSSVAARRDLADELGYRGDPDDLPAMNIWLHRQVMARLAENGGRVPHELRG